MGDVLQIWLRDRLGLIVDLSPDNFGLATRDGTLLAQILHSYDIIDSSQLNTIIVTEDPALARVNLKHLRVWLKFIGVDCDDDTIEDISIGRGTTTTRLFYKIFVSLESKDKLHFITQQKEREKFIPNSSKFEVTTISNNPPTPELSENPLAEQLFKNASVIAWHREKFEAILDQCKLARKRCIAVQKQRKAVQDELRKNVGNEKLDKPVHMDKMSSMEQIIQDIRDFDEKHKVRSPEEYTYHELYNEKKYGEKIDTVPVDPKAAKMYIKCMKNRTRRAAEIFSCKNKMEKKLTARLWEKQKQDQETVFDQAIAEKLFSQSRYEKQMMTKLCEIRDQKRRIARNRELVDKLMQERTSTERNMELAKEHEVIVKEGEDIQAECLRLCELHRRIREEKLRNAQEKLHQMCRLVLDDLIDISLKAADYRENNDDLIPTKIWNEWKALFIKSQPIFETVEHVENLAQSESEENAKEILRAEIKREKILNDADFDNYLNAISPWDEFMPEIDLETQETLRLGVIVLGYIVHRLLQYIYPFEPDPEPAPVPKVSIACILLGVLDASVYPIIQALLQHRGVRLLHMEDAINYCLLCYKNEMREFAYVDLDAMRSKQIVQPKDVDAAGRSNAKKDDAVKKQKKSAGTPKVAITTRGIDEQTQTPRDIPNEDVSPDLSNPAYVGKWAYEYFTLGQPIPNELNTKILIEYMKSLTDVEGWVLVDYPNTFDQMARLETALTGLKIPSDEENIDDFDGNIDELIPGFSRTSYEAEDVNESSVFRESRLVCNPISKGAKKGSQSYMTAYIRALPKPKNMNVDETEIYEILSEDTTPMDSFYTDQGVAYAVYYTSFDMFTIKRLCRLAIGDVSIPRVSSKKLFGDGLDLLGDAKVHPPLSKTPVIKQLIPRPNPGDIHWGGIGEFEGEGSDISEDIRDVVDDQSIPPKPGEEGWEWIRFPQAPMLLEALGTLWENMEIIYIQDLKEIFRMKRVHYSSIVPYRNYVRKHMDEFIERPDIKQDMLHTFHRSYNDIAEDMREDLDVKCELHCRVEDFRTELWEICDDRRKRAEDERQRIILQDWTAEEMVVLSNLFICMIEAEIDRFIDTVQLIQDYYTSMLQRPINVIRLPKYSLQKLELDSNELAASVSVLSSAKTSRAPKVAQSSKSSKNTTSKVPQAAPDINCSSVKKQIADLLIVTEREPFHSTKTPCYEAVHANITYIENVVESTASWILENLKKEQASFIPVGKGRVQTSKAQSLPTANAELMADVLQRGADLCQEWRSALEFEINRMRVRMKLLDNAALSDINFLYETMEQCFHKILENINDRYDREIKSVNDMASIFCFAIEEGVPIQEELILDGDRFIVRSNVLMYPDEPMPPPEPTKEAILPSPFRMGQLGRLMDVFRYVAPHGSLPERCFTYILEDMVICRDEESGMAHLPASWSELRGSEVSDLVAEIFGGSEYVDWREFIIYAMDIPMPSDEQILDVRTQFIAMDPTLTEMVTRDQFHSVNMWFSNCDFKDPCCKTPVNEDCPKDEHEACEEEGKESKVGKTDGSVLPNAGPESKPSFSSKKSFTNSTFSLSSRNMTPQETVRLMLAKELLCEMFASKCNTINYTAFLLAFSKDCDPRKGFGKALTLALGEEVCVSEGEGEKFVADLLNRKQLSAAEGSMRYDEQEAAGKNASSVSNYILDNTLELTDGIAITEIDDSRQYDDRPKSMISEPKQQIHFDDPDTGSSGNLEMLKPDTVPSSTFPPPGSRASDSYETDREVSRTTILAEGYSKESLAVIGQPNVVHWIPRDVCQSVLVASLPWHARQPDILGTTSCLRECLGKVYADLFDARISDEYDYVLSHRLVNHEFIMNLLSSTTAFTMKNIGNILQTLLSRRSDLKQTSNC